MKATSTIIRSRFAVAIIAAMVTAVVVAGSLAGALPGRNTVDGNDIRANVVKSRQIKNGSVSARDVRRNALTGDQIDESRLGPVPEAESLSGVGFALINHRSGDTGPTPIMTLNDLTILVSCSSGDETITATTTATGDNEISALSNDASVPADVFGDFDDDFASGDTFTAGPGAGNSASDRQYLVTFSAADGRNVTATFVTEDSVGGSDCAVSGYAVG